MAISHTMGYGVDNGGVGRMSGPLSSLGPGSIAHPSTVASSVGNSSQALFTICLYVTKALWCNVTLQF